MMNYSFFKILFIFSVITGAILGILPLVPQMSGLAFILLMFFVSPFIIIYFRKLNLIKSAESINWPVIGAISGASAAVGFAIIYFPAAFILQLLFKIQAFIWIKVLFLNIGFLIPMVILTALISALLNAFSAFLTAYFLSSFNKNKQ